MRNINDVPTSPVSGGSCVRLLDSFSVLEIVELYSEQESIDVTRSFDGLDEIYLYECADSGYRFYFPFEIAGDAQFYTEFARIAETGGREYDRDWSDDHKFARQHTSRGDKLLEIGCNTGKFLTGITDLTSKIIGLEFNGRAADVAIERELDVRCESIEEFSKVHPGEFDVVCAFQVLEHVTNVRSFIDSSLKALRPGGKLIFSVPNNDPYFQRHNKYEVLNLPPHHVGLWNLRVFEKLDRYFEMDLVDHCFSGKATFWADLYLRARRLAGVRSLPQRHGIADRLKMLAVSPIALTCGLFDWATAAGNYAHITVIFSKRIKDKFYVENGKVGTRE